MSNWATAVFNNCADWMRHHVGQPCALCGAGGRHGGLCAGCRDDLHPLPQPACPVCATPLATPGTCGACLQHPPRYDAVVAAAVYDFPLDRLVQRLKYGGELRLAALLGERLAACPGRTPDLILPMPLAAGRLRERGYNQALELARVVARCRDVPLAPDACRRVIDTVPQALLPWAARARNVRGAFVCDADLAGLAVAVVDDVVTTGATLGELARVLKRAGATRVEGWTVARAVPRLWRRRDPLDE